MVFNATVLCTAISGLAIPFVKNFNGICVLAGFCGFGAGGNIPVDTLICFEFLSKVRRLPALGICLVLTYAAQTSLGGWSQHFPALGNRHLQHAGLVFLPIQLSGYHGKRAASTLRRS